MSFYVNKKNLQIEQGMSFRIIERWRDSIFQLVLFGIAGLVLLVIAVSEGLKIEGNIKNISFDLILWSLVALINFNMFFCYLFNSTVIEIDGRNLILRSGPLPQILDKLVSGPFHPQIKRDIPVRQIVGLYCDTRRMPQTVSLLYLKIAGSSDVLLMVFNRETEAVQVKDLIEERLGLKAVEQDLVETEPGKKNTQSKPATRKSGKASSR